MISNSIITFNGKLSNKEKTTFHLKTGKTIALLPSRKAIGVVMEYNAMFEGRANFCKELISQFCHKGLVFTDSIICFNLYRERMKLLK